MVKILTKRNKVKCKICKSKLSYEPEDVQDTCRKYMDSRDEKHKYYIICPVCKSLIILGEVYI